jgi:hypothetical protein
MTAEIAIVNRSAVAFAADSAVTIQIGRGQKIYNSAEKIFQYCFQQPVGLMVYNNAEFMNVPIEVVIRKFRKEMDDSGNGQTLSSMENAANRLLQWLRDFPRTPGDEEDHLYRMLVHRFDEMQDQIIKELRTARRGSFVDHLRETLETATVIEESNALPNFLTEYSLVDFELRYGRPCVDAAKKVFGGLATGLESEFVRFSFAVVKSQVLSEQFTGFVVGGFGDDHLFPSICSMAVDGIYFDQIKSPPIKSVIIDRNETRAEVLPFAQQEMAQRFIFGVDEEFERDILAYVKEITADAFKGLGGEAFRTEVTEAVHNRLKDMLAENREYLRQDLVDIVDYMSKSELAEMAHAMVELTSKKRRFSAEAETVGGPIDVAVISRHEGFIWIGRKQYFDPAKNAHYFARVYGGVSPVANSGDDRDGAQLRRSNDGDRHDGKQAFGDPRESASSEAEGPSKPQ